jgi:hypothetical protein
LAGIVDELHVEERENVLSVRRPLRIAPLAVDEEPLGVMTAFDAAQPASLFGRRVREVGWEFVEVEGEAVDV